MFVRFNPYTFMQIYNTFNEQDFQRDYLRLIYQMEWENLADFREKYKDDESRRQAIGRVENFYEGLGVLVYREQIDIRLIDDLMRSYVINFWDKYKPMALEMREINPLVGEWTEYLYNELKKIESKPAYLRTK